MLPYWRNRAADVSLPAWVVGERDLCLVPSFPKCAGRFPFLA
jgi:hypothetical protein